MSQLFSQIDDLPIDTSTASAESFLRGANSAGLIEKQLDAERVAVLLFMGGAPGMAFMLEDGQSRSISLAEFSSIPQDAVKQVRAIKMPDVAGRLALLAFESEAKPALTITDAAVWKRQIDQWRAEQCNALIEIKSEKLHGFALFWRGEFQKADTIFSTPQGFIVNFPEITSTNDFPWNVFAYSLPISEQVCQCAILRHGAMHWTHRILNRYQEMVGHKLLLALDRELNRQIQPWDWNIVLAETNMMDSHFFAYLGDAEQAYRALFMSMGDQMNVVLGSNLTQRLLSETFEQIHPDERAILQSLRLIPAAFSE
jgi:hypothetical protein